MKLLTEQTVSIRCDVHTAFAYVSNMENFPQWFPGVRSVVSANPLPPAEPGKEYLEVVAAPNGEERQILSRVKEVQHDRLFVTEGEYPPLLPRMEISLRSEDANNCAVTWRMLSRNDTPESNLPWLPTARQAIEERARLGVSRLKEKLEND